MQILLYYDIIINKEKQHFITEYDTEEISNDFYYKVVDAILKYRLLQLPYVETVLAQTNKTIIGGCGGDPRQILTNMIRISRCQVKESKIFRSVIDGHLLELDEIQNINSENEIYIQR